MLPASLYVRAARVAKECNGHAACVSLCGCCACGGVVLADCYLGFDLAYCCLRARAWFPAPIGASHGAVHSHTRGTWSGTAPCYRPLRGSTRWTATPYQRESIRRTALCLVCRRVLPHSSSREFEGTEKGRLRYNSNIFLPSFLPSFVLQ